MRRTRRLLTATTLSEAQRHLRAYPECRVLGGGTVLVPLLDRDGRDTPLLDVTGLPAATRLAPGFLGASVSLDAIARASVLPSHLVSASAQVGSPVVRRDATVGGNCAPDVAGCVYLVLLSMRARASVCTETGQVERPLLGWASGAARTPLLVGVSWEQESIVDGAFARPSAERGGGAPLCAVAVTKFADGPSLRVVIGYVADDPVVADLERTTVPQESAAALEQTGVTPTTALRECLADALSAVAPRGRRARRWDR